MENEFFTGSICLSDIPKDLIKAGSDGKLYLNISVGTRTNKETKLPEPDKYGRTHWISCRPKEELRKEGVNYFIGDLTLQERKEDKPLTPEQIEKSPAATKEDIDNLPF